MFVSRSWLYETENFLDWLLRMLIVFHNDELKSIEMNLLLFANVKLNHKQQLFPLCLGLCSLWSV